MICFFFNLDLSQAQDSNEKISWSGETVTLDGMKEGKVFKSDLISADSLNIEQDSAAEYHISAFKLTVVCPSEILEFENAVDGRLTDEMKAALKKTQKGCNVFIEYIKSRSSEGKLYSHPPISYRIVE